MSIGTKNLAAVMFSIAAAALLASCVSRISPEYPKSWPALASATTVSGLGGNYNNRCEDYTLDSTTDKSYRPTLAHLLEVRYALENAESVAIAVSPGGESTAEFRDSEGKALETVRLGNEDGWAFMDGRYVRKISEYSNGGRDSGRGRKEWEANLYKAEDGSLVVRTRFKFTGILYFFFLHDDETQWVWFRQRPAVRAQPEPPNKSPEATPSQSSPTTLSPSSGAPHL